jgi:hypothetical protein
MFMVATAEFRALRQWFQPFVFSFVPITKALRSPQLNSELAVSREARSSLSPIIDHAQKHPVLQVTKKWRAAI